MDPDVVKSLARWPNVPAAYGWLSLTPRGLWRFHAEGRAAEGAAGDQISNERITAFINRNFEHDAQGNWFFQNGPQRAYVRIDAAPLVLRYSTDNNALVTHTGHPCGAVSHWWLDETGRLFATTDGGPCVVDDRELMRVLDDLSVASEPDLNLVQGAGLPGNAPDASLIKPGTGSAMDHNAGITSHENNALLEAMSALEPGQSIEIAHRLSPQSAPLTRIDSQDIAASLGFVACPVPSQPATHPVAP